MARPTHYADRFPRVSRAGPGFADDEVDAWLDRLRDELQAGTAPNAEQIRQVSFREQSGGYRQGAVTEMLVLLALARQAR